MKEASRRTRRHARRATDAWFDFRYQGDYPEMYDLYRRAVQQPSGTATRSSTGPPTVDPRNPEKPVFPDRARADGGPRAARDPMNHEQQMRFVHDFSSWLLSAFMHWREGALFTASAQVDGESCAGRRQVLRRDTGDGRGAPLEVVPGYPSRAKLAKLYQVNDNSVSRSLAPLMRDSRWE